MDAKDRAEGHPGRLLASLQRLTVLGADSFAQVAVALQGDEEVRGVHAHLKDRVADSSLHEVERLAFLGGQMDRLGQLIGHIVEGLLDRLNRVAIRENGLARRVKIGDVHESGLPPCETDAYNRIVAGWPLFAYPNSPNPQEAPAGSRLHPKRTSDTESDHSQAVSL